MSIDLSGLPNKPKGKKKLDLTNMPDLKPIELPNAKGVSPELLKKPFEEIQLGIAHEEVSGLPAEKAPGLIAGVAPEEFDVTKQPKANKYVEFLKGYYDFLHTETEMPKNVSDFFNRVVAESTSKTTVGLVEFPYHAVKSVTDPLLEEISNVVYGKKSLLQADIDLAKKLGKTSKDLAMGVSQFIGEPIGLYGWEIFKKRWASDPAGAIVAVAPMLRGAAPQVKKAIGKVKKAKPTIEAKMTQLKIDPKLAQEADGIIKLAETNTPEALLKVEKFNKKHGPIETAHYIRNASTGHGLDIWREGGTPAREAFSARMKSFDAGVNEILSRPTKKIKPKVMTELTTAKGLFFKDVVTKIENITDLEFSRETPPFKKPPLTIGDLIADPKTREQFSDVLDIGIVVDPRFSEKYGRVEATFEAPSQQTLRTEPIIRIPPNVNTKHIMHEIIHAQRYRKGRHFEKDIPYDARIHEQSAERGSKYFQRKHGNPIEARKPPIFDWELEAKQADLKFEGMQEGIEGVEMPLFTDPLSGTTFTVEAGESVIQALNRKRKQFKLPEFKEPKLIEPTPRSFIGRQRENVAQGINNVLAKYRFYKNVPSKLRNDIRIELIGGVHKLAQRKQKINAAIFGNLKGPEIELTM
ncbi:MAG: hypothetical protein ACW98Y_20205, partial [Candidatus Thorarchaeota archaeon]